MISVGIEGWEDHVFDIAMKMLLKDKILVRDSAVVNVRLNDGWCDIVKQEDFVTTHVRWLTG